MQMKIATIECSCELRLKYNENSPEFKTAFTNYKKAVEDTNATVEDMLNHISHSIIHYTISKPIEGIGFVSHNKKTLGKPYSGIELESKPHFDYDCEIE